MTSVVGQTAGLSAAAEPGAGPTRSQTFRLMCVWVMLLFSVLSWRSGAYYSGGVDPVVAAKAMLSLASLAIAWLTWSASAERREIGARSVLIVSAYLATALLGGSATGTVFASTILTTRIVIVAAAVVLVMSTYPTWFVMSTLSRAMAGMAGLLAVTGAPSLAATGRLGGGLLPVNPNQIAMLVGIPALLAFWRMLNETSGRRDVLMFVVYMGMTWLTGSRTGLIALVIALVVVVLATRRLPLWVHVAMTAAIPAVVFLVGGTNILGNFLSRGNDQTVTTLSNRTIAWSAAFHAPTDFWEHWFGGGLAVKTVAVSGTYWDVQVVDSSWVSAFIQAGVIGFTLLAVFVLLTLLASLLAPSPGKAFWVGVVLYCMIRSFTGSGLVDANSLFMVFFVVAIATERIGRADSSLSPPAPMVSRRSDPGPSSRRTTAAGR